MGAGWPHLPVHRVRREGARTGAHVPRRLGVHVRPQPERRGRRRFERHVEPHVAEDTRGAHARWLAAARVHRKACRRGSGVLEVSEHGVEVEVENRYRRLTMPLPDGVDEKKMKARFDTKLRLLKIYLPAKAGAESYESE